VTAAPGPSPVENPFAGQGAVLLDIGGDVGAVVVEMPAEMVGVEIDIRPAHAHAGEAHGHHHHPHVAVVDRPSPSGSVPSLVFGDVRAGEYVLCGKGEPEGAAVLEVTVRGGEVSQLVWPAAT
jgi:hypothetical protein